MIYGIVADGFFDDGCSSVSTEVVNESPASLAAIFHVDTSGCSSEITEPPISAGVIGGIVAGAVVLVVGLSVGGYLYKKWVAKKAIKSLRKTNNVVEMNNR